jgi:hypothetical protein
MPPGKLYEDTQYPKLSTFSCTFRNGMATIKINMILKDAKTIARRSSVSNPQLNTRNQSNRELDTL